MLTIDLPLPILLCYSPLWYIRLLERNLVADLHLGSGSLPLLATMSRWLRAITKAGFKMTQTTDSLRHEALALPAWHLWSRWLRVIFKAGFEMTETKLKLVFSYTLLQLPAFAFPRQLPSKTISLTEMRG